MKDYKFNPKPAEPDDPVYTDSQSGAIGITIKNKKKKTPKKEKKND